MLSTYDNIGTMNIGNLRETFFVNQFKNGTIIHLAEQGDFLIDEKHTFEIGKKTKHKHKFVTSKIVILLRIILKSELTILFQFGFLVLCTS